jgi:hypothetical protein
MECAIERFPGDLRVQQYIPVNRLFLALCLCALALWSAAAPANSNL